MVQKDEYMNLTMSTDDTGGLHIDVQKWDRNGGRGGLQEPSNVRRSSLHSLRDDCDLDKKSAQRKADQGEGSQLCDTGINYTRLLLYKRVKLSNELTVPFRTFSTALREHSKPDRRIGDRLLQGLCHAERNLYDWGRAFQPHPRTGSVQFSWFGSFAGSPVRAYVTSFRLLFSIS